MRLAEFLDSLAQDWRGKHGESSWEASGEGVSITVHKDPAGHVLLNFALWWVEATDEQGAKEVLVGALGTVNVESSDEMAQLAAGVRRLLTSP
jgi:Family of unknown function (DUF6228)